MSRICRITGKRPINGNKRSHSMNATKRWFIPNIHYHRIWIDSKKKFCSIRISAKGLRFIDKLGIDQYLSNLSSKNIKITKKK
ncbi:50S ribosomal protein L28 [Candidatus Blochmanniella vafra str. BVAF]|uniref:Large ribosomal subunit protein bL28 n=1 Tax=Blochmanniella vafra (strain BVAF) TaxID=859654 RepID=E8Q790_BLOVB|nr:50S ribosomal protein L28 [Candidatus Blochmannia vafer]ADV33985.1 50S ribosomal protein L28 [Candidatus Blochmannia vafer str. BVAF]